MSQRTTRIACGKKKKKQEYCSSRSSLNLTSTAVFSQMHFCISDNNSAALTCFVAIFFIALSSVRSPHWSNRIGLWRKSLRQITVSIQLLSAVFLSRLRLEVRIHPHCDGMSVRKNYDISSIYLLYICEDINKAESLPGSCTFFLSIFA